MTSWCRDQAEAELDADDAEKKDFHGFTSCPIRVDRFHQCLSASNLIGFDRACALLSAFAYGKIAVCDEIPGSRHAQHL